MDRNECLREIEPLLQADPGSLTPESLLADQLGWDSVGQLSVIGYFDDKYQVVISVKKMRECKTLGELLDLADTELMATVG